MKFIKTIMFVFMIAAWPALAGAVNINTADATTLATELVGVGESRAQAIIEYREKNGPFKSIDELAQVDGIGYRTLEKNRAKVEIK